MTLQMRQLLSLKKEWLNMQSKYDRTFHPDIELYIKELAATYIHEPKKREIESQLKEQLTDYLEYLKNNGLIKNDKFISSLNKLFLSVLRIE